MSMMLCADCGTPVDTDDEPESFVDIGLWKHGYRNTICLCLTCREQREFNEENMREEEQ